MLNTEEAYKLNNEYHLLDAINRQVVSYDEFSASYERSLSQKQRKSNGVFYTDTHLASLIVDDLNILPNDIVLDPCCGSGSFLYVANQRGFNNIHGMDLDGNAFSVLREFVSDVNLVAMDSIFSPSEKILSILGVNKVDFVVGNPPYVPIKSTIAPLFTGYNDIVSSNKNLFVYALARGIDLLTDGGVLSYIIPKNFLHVSSYAAFRKDILKNKTIVSIVDIGAYFKDVKGEQIVITIKNTRPIDNNIIIKKLFDGRFNKLLSVKQSFFNDEIMLFSSKRELDVYTYLNSTHKTLKDICSGYIGRGRDTSEDALVGKDIRKFGYKNRDVPVTGRQIFIQNIYSSESGIIAAFAGDLKAAETITVFTDGERDMCKYVLGILHSTLCNFFLYKFCFNSSKITLHTDAKYLKRIPFIIKDKKSFDGIVHLVEKIEQTSYMSADWYKQVSKLNSMVYDVYGIPSEEAEYISNEMKTIQSDKWNS